MVVVDPPLFLKFIGDAPDCKIWFRFETEAAEQKSVLMAHTVAKHFRGEREKVVGRYQPKSSAFIEQNIWLAVHVQREMMFFLTLSHSMV